MRTVRRSALTLHCWAKHAPPNHEQRLTQPIWSHSRSIREVPTDPRNCAVTVSRSSRWTALSPSIDPLAPGFSKIRNVLLGGIVGRACTFVDARRQMRVSGGRPSCNDWLPWPRFLVIGCVRSMHLQEKDLRRWTPTVVESAISRTTALPMQKETTMHACWNRTRDLGCDIDGSQR